MGMLWFFRLLRSMVFFAVIVFCASATHAAPPHGGPAGAPSGNISSPLLQASPDPEDRSAARIRDTWRQALIGAITGPATVPVADQGVLTLPGGYVFIPTYQARLLTHVTDADDDLSIVGLILPKRGANQRFAIIRWRSSGHLSDQDITGEVRTRSLMGELYGANERTNAARREGHVPPVTLRGWGERPSYDAATHTLRWAMELTRQGAAASSASSLIRAVQILGRYGVITISLDAGAPWDDTTRVFWDGVINQFRYLPGHAYQDFVPGSDNAADNTLSSRTEDGTLPGWFPTSLLPPSLVHPVFEAYSNIVAFIDQTLMLWGALLIMGVVYLLLQLGERWEPGKITMGVLGLIGACFKMGKVSGTFGSMLISLGGYAYLYGWRYALGFIGMIFAHEMGHYVAARQRGLAVGAPTFIPFVGAWVALKDKPMSVAVESYVAIAGPVTGTVVASLTYLAARDQVSPLLLAVAFSGFALNFLNLLPVPPLDGGRVIAILTPRIWLIGAPLLLGLLYLSPSPLLLLILLLSTPHVLKAWRHQSDNQDYYAAPLWLRILYGIIYLFLAAYLCVMATLAYHDLSLQH